jgi:ADP-ribosylglycohydrolase
MKDTSLHQHILGTLLGLAFGDSIGFPAMFHKTHQFPEKRRHFLWRMNRQLASQRIIRLMLPYTHRNPAESLEPFPTDDTEWALFSSQAILSARDEADGECLIASWKEIILPQESQVLTGFSERAAIENLKAGYLPPVTGNDNPMHYDDSAAVRAIAAGLYWIGSPGRASELAEQDAQITNAEDGVYAARSMATAISLLASGRPLTESLQAARNEFPHDTWIAHGNQIALDCLDQCHDSSDLILYLSTRLINTVYSYGNVAPETLPAAYIIATYCDGDLLSATLLANAIPKAADSLPALVGALCGAYRGSQSINEQWRAQLDECRGLCIPSLRGARLSDIADQFNEVNLRREK